MLHNKLPFVEIWLRLNATKLNNVKYFADVERKHVYIEDLQESWPILCSFLAVNFAIFVFVLGMVTTWALFTSNLINNIDTIDLINIKQAVWYSTVK